MIWGLAMALVGALLCQLFARRVRTDVKASFPLATLAAATPADS